MNEVRSTSGHTRRAWRRLLSGDRSWGFVDIRPDRFGVTRYRLVVYPPGIDESDRRRIRAARGWPLWGVVVWIGCEVFLGHHAGPWEALAISTAVYLGLGLVAVAMAGELRTQVRTIAASVMVGYPDSVSAAATDKVTRLAARLLEADECLRDGLLSPIEHEMIWWNVYDESARAAPPRPPPRADPRGDAT